MIPGFDFMHFAQVAGPLTVLLVVAGIIFAESGLLIGFFLPGDSILFTLGFLIQGSGSFRLDLNIVFAVAVLFMAAVIGDNVGYTFGRKLGHRLFTRPNSLLFRQENIQKAQEFYEKHGGKTIIFARFIPVIRTFAPLIAGVAKMNYRSFVMYNLIGGFVWTAGLTYLGFFLGKFLHDIGIDIDAVLLPFVALLMLLSVAPALYHFIRNKKQRQVIWNATKQEFKRIILRQK